MMNIGLRTLRLAFICSLIFASTASRAATYYETLRVPVAASEEDIKKAYRTLAQKWHPDKFKQGTAEYAQAEINFKAIGEAYSVLKDDYKRSLYNHRSEYAGTIFERRDDENDGPTVNGWGWKLDENGLPEGIWDYATNSFKDTFYFDEAKNQFVEPISNLRFAYDHALEEWISTTSEGRYKLLAVHSRGLIKDRVRNLVFIPSFAQMTKWRFDDTANWYPGWLYEDAEKRHAGKAQLRSQLAAPAGVPVREPAPTRRAFTPTAAESASLKRAAEAALKAKQVDVAPVQLWLMDPASVEEPTLVAEAVVHIMSLVYDQSDPLRTNLLMLYEAFRAPHWLHDPRAIEAREFVMNQIAKEKLRTPPSQTCESVLDAEKPRLR